jgi:putative transcriptional regulator
MTIRHHPPDALLSAFAAGTLDPGEHVAVGTHLFACERCRAWTRAMEHVGAAMLAALPATPMAADAWSRVERRLKELPENRACDEAGATFRADDVAGLPEFVRQYPLGNWKWVAPGIHLRSIGLPDTSPTRAFLLKSGPGRKLLRHSHTGLEMTCVLTGAFSHDGNRFEAGDFDLGDETVDHEPVVDARAECICLIAMRGGVRLNGLMGRLMQPFLRL